ncbi:hypothetical protein FOA43_003184 [Brettanomyces nanus]|uniref:J domain-containing protein n=1 Tax=Eeniella nana TaxID=13502 RepID=A0A875S7A1_EENNA|nr:uncharacterized protein FOA43_003184 [Brettanomyces nanus]QPG75822.1 hypothetical protein FOA43_003184 [Brettanomyces nanus]
MLQSCLYKHPTVVRITTRCITENHYKNLDLDPTADLKQIKKSFKRLSMKLHPDILLSQELPQDMLRKKKNHYLQIKKSYELLMDPEKKASYDRNIAVRTAAGARKAASTNSQRGNFFHYTRVRYPQSVGYDFGDSSHFDSKKHMKRNMANEQRIRERKIIQFGDLFRHDLNTRNIAYGVHKGLHQFHTGIDEAEREKAFLWRLFVGFVGMMVAWELTIGRVDSGNTSKKNEIHYSPHSETHRDELTPSLASSEYTATLLSNAIEGSGGRTKKANTKS